MRDQLGVFVRIVAGVLLILAGLYFVGSPDVLEAAGSLTAVLCGGVLVLRAGFDHL